jgi:hypothetical protein
MAVTQHVQGSEKIGLRLVFQAVKAKSAFFSGSCRISVEVTKDLRLRQPSLLIKRSPSEKYRRDNPHTHK